MLYGSFYLYPPAPSSHCVPRLCILYIHQYGREKLDIYFELSLSKFIYLFNRVLSNLCETASLITSSSAYGVKSIYLPVIGFSLVHLEARNNLNVEYIEIDTILLTIQQT